MSKIRRVDFNPDEFLAGVIGLTAAQVGVYWVACSLIYSRGGPISHDDERLRLLRDDPRTVAAALRHLVSTGKMSLGEDGTLMVGRCREELDRAAARIKDAFDAAQKRWGDRGDAPRGARETAERVARGSRDDAESKPRGTSADAERLSTAPRDETGILENQTLADATALSSAMPSLTTNHQPSTTNTNTSSKPSALMSFAEFWKVYPRKVGKLAAERAFKRLQGKMPPAAEVKAAIDRYIAGKRDDIDFCHPTTWLNQGRWSDGEDDGAPAPAPALALTEDAPEWAKRLAASIGMTAFSQWFRSAAVNINTVTDQIEVVCATAFAADRIKRDYERHLLQAFDRPANQPVLFKVKPRKEEAP